MRIHEGSDFYSLGSQSLHDRSYKIINRWLKTVKAGTSQDVADLYAERGVLLGTVARNIKQGRSVIKTYFDSFLKKHPIGLINSMIFQDLVGNHVVADGNYTFELDGKDGGRVSVLARFTFVINLGTGLIVTHHSSSNPEDTPI
jgi:hypothetical protein